MTERNDPIISDVISIPLPPRSRRGPKQHPSISQYIDQAINGRKTGIYETAEQAAYAIATQVYERDHRNYEALRAQLRRKFKEIFAE